MAKAAMKASLDALFGEMRDGESGPKKRFDDPDVCRNYLLNFCINDILLNAKRTAACTKVHSRQLQLDYEAACKKEGHDFGYPYDLRMELKRLVDDCERDIARGAERCASEAGETLQTVSEDSQEVKDVVNQIKELQKQAEVLGGQGQVDEAAAMLSLVKDLEAKKTELTGKRGPPIPPPPANMPLFPRTGNKENDEAAALLEKDPVASRLAMAFRTYPNQKLRVCEVCAAFLSQKDNAKRLADHFTGKTHTGYLAIREKLKELDTANVQPLRGGGRDRDSRRDLPRAQFPVQFPVSSRTPDDSSSASSSSSSSSSSSDVKDKERENKERDGRSRDRERERNRDRSRDRRDRDRDRSRDRDRDRDRRRDRSRDRDRDRRRRSRSRSRDRRDRRDRSRSRDRR